MLSTTNVTQILTFHSKHTIQQNVTIIKNATITASVSVHRLRGSNEINQKLLSSINASGKLHMVPASLNDKYVIRFCVCRQTATDADIGKLHLFSVKKVTVIVPFKITYCHN